MPPPTTLTALAERTAAPVEKPRRTLLIVDDEEGPRQSLRVVFKEDYNLLIAADGQRAVELAQEHKINAAVVDIRMTGMTGTEVLEKLKAIQPSVEVIMLTAYETVDTIRRALRLGACDYLNKPFDIATIRKAVATAMERHSLTDEIRSNNEKLQALQAELHNQKLQEEIARTRGEIYASIIHDINGPLTIISGFIQIINQRVGESKRLEGEDLEMVKDRLRRITRQVSNCIDISHRYLNFMRQQGTAPAWISVNQILDDLRELLNVHPSKGSNPSKSSPGRERRTANQRHRSDPNPPQPGHQRPAMHPRPARCGHLRQCPAAPAWTSPNSTTAPTDRMLNSEGFNNTPPLLHLSVRDDGPGIPAGSHGQIFSALLHHQTPRQRHGPGPGHCPAPAQGGPRLPARPFRAGQGHLLQHLPPTPSAAADSFAEVVHCCFRRELDTMGVKLMTNVEASMMKNVQITNGERRHRP